MKIEDRRTGKKPEMGSLDGGSVFEWDRCPGFWLVSDGKVYIMNLETGALEDVQEKAPVSPVVGKFVAEDDLL